MRITKPTLRIVELWAVATVALLGYSLRVYGIGHQALRGDEAFSVRFSSQPLPDIVRAMGHTEPNPPLYSFLLNAWMHWTGQSEFAIRWPSVLAGVLAVAITFRLGRTLAGSAVGLISAVLVAVSPFLVWYSQDARVYALLSVLILAALWTTWEAVRRNHWRAWLLAGTLWWLALFAHYLAVLPFAIAVVALPARPETRYRWRAAASLALGVGLAYLPWALYVAPLLAGHSKAWITSAPLVEILRRTLAAASAGTPATGATRALQLAGVVLLTPLVAVGTRWAFQRSRSAALYMLAAGLGPPLALWLISFIRPAFTEQYVISSLAVLLIIAAWGAWALVRVRPAGIWLSVGVAIGWLIMVLLAQRNYFSDPAFAKSPNWRGLVAYLEETARPGEVVVLNLPDPAFYYYYHGPAPVEASPPAPLAEAGVPATEAQLRWLTERFSHVRFFHSPSPGYDPDGFVGAWLEACCEKLADTFVYGFRVQSFDTPAGSLAARQPYPVEFEHGIILSGYRVLDKTIRTGDNLHLTLYWTTQAPIADSYTVFVHLLAPDGFNVADADSLPDGGARPTNNWTAGAIVIDPHLIQMPAGLSPGDYGIEIGLYLLDTGRRLARTDSASQDADFVLLPVTVSLDAP